MACEQFISHSRTIPITFSTRAGPDMSYVVLYADAYLGQDADFVYLKLNVIGIHSDKLVRKPDEIS